jgi:tape measure domain-containing protein
MAEQLTIRISAQSQEAEAALKRVTQNIQQLSNAARQAGANITRGLSLSSVTAFAERASASLKKLEQGLSQLSSRIAAVSAAWTAATTAFGAGALKAGMELERLQIQFRIITGSAKEAARMLDALRQMSQTSVFDFKVLAEAAAMLGSQIRAAGGDVQQVIPFLQRIQALAVAFGQTTPEALEGIVRAFSQIIAKGRVQMEELLQLSERMIPAHQLLAKGLGLTAEQLGKIGELGIPAAKAINAIFAEAERQGILKRASEIQTFAAAFSTLRQTVWEAMGRIGLAIGQAVQGPIWELIKRLQELMQSEAFKVFAQRIAEAAANGVRFLANLVDKIRELMETFRQLPTWAQKGLAALMVNGPIVLAAVAGITKLASAVLGLARVLSVDLVIAAGKAAAAIRNITVLSWGARAGLIGIMAAAGGLVLAHEAQRTLAFAQAQAEERERQRKFQEAIKTIQRLSQQQPMRVLTPEERRRRIAEISHLFPESPLKGMLPLPEKPPVVTPTPTPKPAMPPFELKLPAVPVGGKEAERRRQKAEQEARKRVVDLLQDQIEHTEKLIRLEEYRFAQLVKQGRLQEAEALLQQRIIPLLNQRSQLELRLEQVQKGRITDADKAAQFVERQLKVEQLLNELNEARKKLEEERLERLRKEAEFREQVKREADDLLQTEVWSVEQRIRGLEAQKELVADTRALVNINMELADLYEYLAQLLNQQAQHANTLLQRIQLVTQAAEALRKAEEIRPRIQVPFPEAVPEGVPPQAPPAPPFEPEEPMIAALPARPRFFIPAEVEWEAALTRVRAMIDVARTQLEIMKMQVLSRQELRQAEIATLQTILQQLQAEREILKAQLEQLRTSLEQLKTKADLTEEDLKRAAQIRSDIARTEAELMRLDAQIQLTTAEIARNNPFVQFREGIEDAFRRFEDAIADALAGVGSLRRAFSNLWQEIKRQFWRVVVQETLSPLINWLRNWARQLGEAIFGGILRQPVLTAGLVPTGGAGGGIGLPLPAIILPPEIAGAAAAVAAAAMGANKELSALTGAAIGFAVGGPVGAVIGGLAGLLFGGKKKKSASVPVIPLGAAVYGPSINLSTAVTLQVDGRELGRVLVRQAV